MNDKISVRGARVHNLRNIDIDLPRHSLVVLTGLSGSGKSSLAFDTIYAEGQRRYVESLSAYARQFLGQMEKPDVDSIDGLSPAISIDQKTTSRNPRSTVGTVTEIYDYLRLLWARVGHPHCPDCGCPVQPQSEEEIVDKLLGRKEQFLLLSPLVRDRKGQHSKLLQRLRDAGWSRVAIDSRIYRLDNLPSLQKQKRHSVALVIDRLQASPAKTRLRESIRTALQESGGMVQVADPKLQTIETFSQSGSCPDCGRSLPELEPRLFSFNSPHGACQECHGLGYKQTLDPELLVPDPTLSLAEGALDSFQKNSSRMARQLYQAVADDYKIDINAPWQKLSASDRQVLLYGTDRTYNVSWRSRYGAMRNYKDVPFPGALRALERQHARTGSEWKRRRIESMMSQSPCPACQGARLSPEALSVRVGDLSIWEFVQQDIAANKAWIDTLRLRPAEKKIARLLLREIQERLDFLLRVGLSYLSLDRTATTLSGGEAQRIRLATQIGSALSGVLYVLDEPSIGLHQRDNDRLLETLQNLRDLGNTVLVVEHDEATMRAADWLVDLGPGAGRHGGEVVAEGTPRQVARSKTLTGQYLSGQRSIPRPSRPHKPSGKLRLIGARQHNLQNIDVSFPLGVQTAVTGVSGSGKSTLVNEILYPALANRLQGARRRAGDYDRLEGAEQISKVVQIDQSPIGRTPRSNPATYTGIFDLVRQIFAETPEARARGYKPGRFSFNVQGGRCETCHGDGQLRIEMHFLPDVYVECEACEGRRYNKETLEILYGGQSIADILEMPVDDALKFFKKVPRIRRRLQTLQDVGLGYLHLGQPATELSGGEAQRVKLASELSRVATGDTLYILDEPTTGLHFEDVRRLLEVLGRLRDSGNTVIVIEHNLDVIAASDRIIDLGPEGGSGGGQIVAEGTPRQVARSKRSHTGRFLREHL